MDYKHIKAQDEEVYDAIEGEEEREREGLELIPSENYVSLAVREAMSSVLTNKYSEGYPGKRYYGGQQFTDQVETIAIERAKKLLAETNQKIETLAGMCGYQSANSFCVAFKQTTGMSPKQFRDKPMR